MRLLVAGAKMSAMADRAEGAGDPGQTCLLWGVGAVSRRLGVTTPTLRTWDRRYGLSPSVRTVGGHRRYSEQDVARVARACRLIATGVPPAQAALIAVSSVSIGVESADRPGPVDQGRPADDGSLAGDRSAVVGPVTVELLLQAAEALDAPTLSLILARVLDQRGVVRGWTEVLAPFLGCVGEKWVAGSYGVEAEHLASECVSTELRHRLRDPERAMSSSPPVLLAGACGDRHALPLVALVAALSDLRIRTWLLGCCLPSDALVSAIERVAPRAVFLWSSLDPGGQLGDLGTVRAVAPDPMLLLGGPGWSRPGADETAAGDPAADEPAADEPAAGGPKRRRASHTKPVASEWVPDLGTAVERITALVA